MQALWIFGKASGLSVRKPDGGTYSSRVLVHYSTLAYRVDADASPDGTTFIVGQEGIVPREPLCFLKG